MAAPGADVVFATRRHPGQVGAVAQLGERRVRNAEVRGSIPLGSTKVLNGFNDLG